MRKILLAIMTVSGAAAGCATAPQAPFDPGSDPRVGAEVSKVCLARDGGPFGGYVSLAGRPGFVVASGGREYALLLSSGCSDLRSGGTFPIFEDRTDRCRRRGELVRTGGATIGAACVIERMFEWNPDASLSPASATE